MWVPVWLPRPSSDWLAEAPLAISRVKTRRNGGLFA